MARNPSGAWLVIAPPDDKTKSGDSSFRSEGAAQRVGSSLIDQGKADEFKVFKLVSTHH